jgi:hypothetical protein
MKKFIPAIILVIFIIPAGAQTKSAMIYSNALQKDKSFQTIGTIMTLVGGATLFTGNLMYKKVYNDFGNTDVPRNKVNTAMNIMYGGAGLMAVGIPLVTIGRLKEQHLKIEAQVVKFRGYAYTGGIGIKLRF